MADQLKLRGGSEDASKNFTGAAREVTVDTTDWTLRVHDGVTAGGHKLLKSGNCLVVEEADKCDPTKPTCKVTVNGNLEVSGETNLGDTVIDGNLVIDGSLIQHGPTVGVKTNEVILTNPGAINTRAVKAVCKILPSSPPLRTQEDANQYLDTCLLALENAICDFDVTAIGEIQDIKDDLQKIWIAIGTLENRADQLEIDMAALAGRVDLLEKAVGILETEIEALQNQVTENSKAIEALKVLVLDLEKEVENINNNISDIQNQLKDLDLDDLKDVHVPAPAEGDVLVFDSTQQLWVSGPAPDTTIDTDGVNDLIGEQLLNEHKDVMVPKPKDHDYLCWDDRLQLWVAKSPLQMPPAIQVKGIIDVSKPAPQNPDYGDLWIHHNSSIRRNTPKSEDYVIADPTWVGIEGQHIHEGEYVIYSTDDEWHHTGNDPVELNELQSDWEQADPLQPDYIHNKPDLQSEIDDKAGDGAININAGAGLVASGQNATANQKGDTTRTLSIKAGSGIEIGADGSIIIDPNFNLDGNVTAPNDGKLTFKNTDGDIRAEFSADTAANLEVTILEQADLPIVNDGKLTIKDSDGTTVGEFTANQAGSTDVSLPKGFSGSYNDLSDKPSSYPPSTHGHGWGEISGKPSTYPPDSHGHGWGEISSKPSTYPPSAHGHAWSEISGVPTLAGDYWTRTGSTLSPKNGGDSLSIGGSITASGDVTAFSDITLKANIEVIPDALSKVLSLRGVTFNRNDISGQPRQSGVIAQEVEAVLPEVVSTNEDGIKSVAYGNMVGLLIEAIKELQERVKQLEAN